MDKFKTKTASARGRVAEKTSRGTGSASLAVPHSTLPPEDNASTTAVNEGFLGPQPGTAARDFAVRDGRIVHEPVFEPPTSLASSVDAGKPVPGPPRNGNPSSSGSSASTPGRARSNSAPNRPAASQRPRPQMGSRQPSIGIRRSDAAPSPCPPAQLQRSTSRLPALEEECHLAPVSSNSTDSSTPKAPAGRLRKIRSAVQTRLGFGAPPKEVEAHEMPTVAPVVPSRDYGMHMVDVLDTLDPEVQTLATLTNIQNSLFVPNLGRFVNRRPTYNLQRAPSDMRGLENLNSLVAPAQSTQTDNANPRLQRSQTGGTVATLATIDSRLSDSRFAVLPSGTSLEGWSKEDKAEMNDHVRHMLHSKRSKFKRSMKGFMQYTKRPLGFLVTLYATLITIFGLAWVLFLIGWINVGGKQIYVVHIIDSVLVALFAVVGDGLAPFRAIDTYHMIYIAHYHHYTWQRRKKEMLPELTDHNDLPSGNAPVRVPRAADPEDPEKQWEFTVLTPKQQAKLEHHQGKFSSSHSFYKPHETETHHAFPLRFLVAIVVLLDCHSLLQISLGACTWGIYYKTRNPAITTVILCCSITINAVAGLLITIGDRRTRKKDVIERMNRQELTEEAIQKVEKRKGRESESELEDNEEAVGKSRRSLNLIRKNSPSGSAKHKDSGRREKEQSAYP
ncbi:hypothetical protein BDV95DRAFT_609429 [Massariosphaeria phaeospora]|uniref:Integral membrane protein n=1 Tax=Massariosphaeria phaeospora TaxID=100035 RepID=A0A7C8M5H2_9PLEO|nr:hypothetical protein BDV95DRAFT_609429 [Massariosphaeria phaeospora]